MKNWLAAKAEEERRKQEEEKTRQESLRLEQRKVEQSMLRESMQGGIPPHLVPIIFAGIGGGNLANTSAEWIQQYTPHVQAGQQPSQQMQAQTTQHSPDLRRDPRMIGQSQAVFAAQPPASQTILPPTSVLPGQPLSAQPLSAASGYTDSRSTPSAGFGGPPTSAPRPPQSQLPRLSTNEMNIQQPPAAPSGVQQLQQATSAQQEQSSPSIYFHHWVPPSASSQQEKSASGNPPATPSGKYKTSPTNQSRQRATSYASDMEHTSSPKKRKAQGPHQAAPPPTSAPQYTSPSFSHLSSSSASTPARRGHARGHSDASQRAPDGASGTLSRRSTVSGLVRKTLPRQEEQHSEESRAAEDMTRPDSEHHQPPYPTSPHRHDDRSRGQQGHATLRAETQKYGAHQHWDQRPPMSSPKREAGDH